MSGFDFKNYYDDEYVSPHEKYIFGDTIDNKQYYKDNNLNTPLISYDYIILDENLNHSFNQACIDRNDILQYFTILKQLSNTVINEAITKGDRGLHLHIYEPSAINRRLKQLLNNISGQQLGIETMPSVGQFALYTCEGIANREQNIKSPRIYFILINATFYILFYDPYHEINPGLNNGKTN